MSRFEIETLEGFSFKVDPSATKILTNANIDKLNDMQTAIEGLTGEHAEYISPPTGGTMIDSEARTAINAIITALVQSGVIDPEV